MVNRSRLEAGCITVEREDELLLSSNVKDVVWLGG